MVATVAARGVEKSRTAKGACTRLEVLVRKAQRGDREAFGRLVEQFQGTVYALAMRRLGNSNDALELSQDVFIHVMQRIGQLREPERFAGWLRQVVARMAINRVTRRVPPLSVEDEVLDSRGYWDAEPVDMMITHERAERVRESLGNLRQIDREALTSFYINGQSLSEIAERLNAPIGTIKRRLHTARKRLRLELESSVANPTEWIDDDEFAFELAEEPASAE